MSAIATGVIEGACRYLVKDRMDRTGARWSLTGAEAVLRVEGKHPRTGQFEFRSGFRSRTEARNFADTQLAHVGNRENRLRDGGY